jgi:hypothetical protein
VIAAVVGGIGARSANSSKCQARCCQTIPNNRPIIHVPSDQPIAIINPHTNHTSNAFAETSGNMTQPPFDRQDGLSHRAPE